MIDEYFHEELGYRLFDTGDNKGRIDNTFQGIYAIDLFKHAGDAEDGWPLYWRAYNHYHDPLKSWDQSGYTNPFWFNGISSIAWAQYNRLQTPPGLVILSLTGGNAWTWDSAYQYFLGGLTASDDETRKQNLANLFTALGHLTHLVADTSVPEHSRNDGHFFRNYEDWCKENLSRTTSTAYGLRAFRYEFPPDNAIFAQGQGSAFGSGPLSPVSNLWDSRSSATGYNPLLSGTERLAGLADYSNYNYFSGDTVFDNTTYDHPSRAEAWLDMVVAKDGKIDKVIYFKRFNSDEVLVSHLAAAKMLYKDFDGLTAAEKGAAKFTVAAQLDENCWEEYASNLVPRAVSYGTALVDYFFRGKFNVTSDGYTLTVTNLSRGTVDGLITIYADDANGVRTSVPGFADYPLTLAADNTMTLSGFNPSGSRNNQYTLVFRGQMQNTGPGGASTWDNVVAGKVFLRTPPALPDNIVVGANPHGLALAPNGRRLYVANTASSTVSVIDTATRQVTATINVGAGPVDVAVSPDSSRAFVSNEWDRSVSVIDTGNNQVVATITGLPPWPEELAVTPDGRFVYLAHWSFTPLTVIDSGSLAHRSYTSPANPCQGVALHPESPAAYLTYYTFYWRNAVAAVDRSSLGLIAAIPGPDLNWSATIGGANRSLYVANPQLNTVSVYDTRTNQPAGTIAVGRSPRGMAASPDGTRVYVANLYDDTVSVIDTSNNTVIDPPLKAGDGAYDVAVSPDGAFLYVTNAFEGTVRVLAADGGAAAQTSFSTMAMAAASPEEVTWGTVVLTGFPLGGRVLVDGEFPRWAGSVEGGTAVSFTAGAHTLHLACPGYIERAFPVSVDAGEIVTVDGQLQMEP